ncbi:helix-turn-helix transcriptional regulator [Dactylosporangium salmoneum]|uniref:HTH cro/C1-type domain-containing protein n=1 Tax=Dactylosporangium salmoneum TaxID=53361 RepID=A0ABP5T818_9ACTN
MDVHIFGVSMKAAIPIGDHGRRLAANIKRIREQQRISLVELSALVARHGRQIGRMALSRIESNERHVDLDDLVALAAALGVPAERLAFEDGLTVEIRPVDPIQEATT